MGKHTVAIINSIGKFDVEAHKPGCRDIAKKSDGSMPEPWVIEIETQREAFLEYNEDFIAEADGDESNGWHIEFFPCTGKVPVS